MNDASVFIIMAFIVGFVLGALLSLLISLNKGLVLSKLHKADADALKAVLPYAKMDFRARCRNNAVMDNELGKRFASWKAVNMFVNDMIKLLGRW